MLQLPIEQYLHKHEPYFGWAVEVEVQIKNGTLLLSFECSSLYRDNYVFSI